MSLPLTDFLSECGAEPADRVPRVFPPAPRRLRELPHLGCSAHFEDDCFAHVQLNIFNGSATNATLCNYTSGFTNGSS